MKLTPISRIQSLLTLPPEAPVRLYSYQGQDAWEIAQERGYWAGSPIPCLGDEDQFVQAYDWMRDQMAQTIPDFTGDYPLWFWTKRPSTKPGKSKRFFSDQSQIRLTIQVPRSRILLSDYDRWHSVLNRWFLAKTESELDAHEAANLTGPELQSVLHQSWLRCLDFTPTRDLEELRWSGSSKYFQVQACVDRVYWNEIVDVRRF